MLNKKIKKILKYYGIPKEDLTIATDQIIILLQEETFLEYKGKRYIKVF